MVAVVTTNKQIKISGERANQRMSVFASLPQIIVRRWRDGGWQWVAPARGMAKAALAAPRAAVLYRRWRGKKGDVSAAPGKGDRKNNLESRGIVNVLIWRG